MGDGIQWVELSPVERSRTYHFPNGQKFTFNNVARIEIRSSGKHRIETTDGKRAFVNTGWEVLEIDVDAWTT